FSSGAVTFNFSNYNLNTGHNYFWLTYDVDSSAQVGRTLDAKVLANSFSINGSTYPAVDQSPAGSRTIYTSIFNDDFEKLRGWELSGEFQIDSCRGLGGATMGYPDPARAFSGGKVLGTDLNGLGSYKGDYEPGITSANAYIAKSPLINCKYFKNINLRFMEWLNFDNADDTRIEISTDNGVSWTPFWIKDGFKRDHLWHPADFNLSSFADRQQNISIRYNLDYSDNDWQFSGWNIDDFLLSGYHITRDVGISRIVYPANGCGHGNGEVIRVVVKNYGDGPSPASIPVGFSLDGGKTFISETINQVIAKDDSVSYTFSSKVDLHTPDVYDMVASTLLKTDEYLQNDSVSYPLYVLPTYTLPYADNMEQSKNFWRPYGRNYTWQHGIPDGPFSIRGAASGQYAWVTNLTGFYQDRDSSFLESPCFDLTKNEKPVFECKIRGDFSLPDQYKHTDGACLQYSVDGGVTWNLVPKHDDTYKWPWYNASHIAALNSAGWDTTSSGWTTMRQILPDELAGKPNVKLRFHFASDTISNSEGIGIDDVKIYESPYDIGVSSIDGLTNNTCPYFNSDKLRVTIKNFGINAMHPGDTIIVGAKIDNLVNVSGLKMAVVDTFKLSDSLKIGQTLQYTFKKPLPINNLGSNVTEHIKAYTLIERDPYMYHPGMNNDTATFNLTLEPAPQIHLLDTIKTARVDTVVLRPGYKSTWKYYWSNGSTDSIAHITAPGKYTVKVTDQGGGCFQMDSTVVARLIPDIGIDSIISPVSACSLGNASPVSFRIRNLGTDTIAKNYKIFVSFQVNNNPAVTESRVFSSGQKLAPDSTFRFDFAQRADFSALVDTPFHFKVYTRLSNDTIARFDNISINDTLKRDIHVWGYPNIDLGHDTTLIARQFVIDAGSGFSSYHWNDGTTLQTDTARFSGNYKITVTNTYGCSAIDSVRVRLKFRDVGVKDIVNPVSDCTHENPVSIQLKIFNLGNDTIKKNDSIFVGYQVKYPSGTSAIIGDTAILQNDLKPSDSTYFSFKKSEDFSQSGGYQIKAYTLLKTDLNIKNDSIAEVVNTWGIPKIDLGPDKDTTGVVCVLKPGDGFQHYLWQDGTTSQNYTIYADSVSGVNQYKVKVWNSAECQASDSVLVILKLYDFTPARLVSPVSGCGKSTNENVKVKILNHSNIAIAKGTKNKILVSYILNDQAPVLDTIAILTDLQPSKDSITVDFPKTINLNSIGDYHFKIITSLIGIPDLRLQNDTLEKTVSSYKAIPPIVFTGEVNDTIKTSFPHVLDAGAGFSTYLWQDSSANETYQVTAEGTYSVQVTDASCCKVSKSVVIKLNTAVNTLDKKEDILVYPNPVSNILYVNFPAGKYQDWIAELIDIHGRLLFNKKIQNGGQLLDMSSFAVGIYYLRLINKDGLVIKKVIKE
ncbi:MAG: T9SS type A sorting domain-containing protein, partial [Bacteroidota bacterium]|nr:T9SS type A sorting domain-containing protein [Bacteroidota bacterium]